MRFDKSFYKNKRVLITGHTGFKGVWMTKVLLNAGAAVTGYALEAPTDPSLYKLCGYDRFEKEEGSLEGSLESSLKGSPDGSPEGSLRSVIGDIRDLSHLMQVFEEVQPEIVIHMAAQPLVRESYRDPVNTYEINVMGTVNICEAVRLTKSVRSFVNVTTDKVYLNREWQWGYRENEELNGFDPYSNSKSCSELVTSSYKNSFFGGDTGVMADGREIAVSTCRAGNVIGGGDFAADRIIPDCIRAVSEGREIVVRNPYSTRPYQHVLEPIMVYLQLAQLQYEDRKYAGNYNVGPDDADCWTTGRLVDSFCRHWQDGASWVNRHDGGPHEANFLKLDCSKLKSVVGWKPRWSVEDAMEKIVEWTKVYLDGGDVSGCMDRQIEEFIEA